MTEHDKKALKLEKKRLKAMDKVAKETRSVSSGLRSVADGVEVTIDKAENGSRLVVSGLNDAQLNRLLPRVAKEVLISIVQDQNSFKAAAMKFVREGLFQTIIKVIAGLVVGYVLIKVGVS